MAQICLYIVFVFVCTQKEEKQKEPPQPKKQEKDFTKWNTNDLIYWLKGLDSNYEKYCKRIKEDDIDGGDLVHIEDKKDLKEWDVKKPAHRDNIWNNIQKLIKNKNKLSSKNDIQEKKMEQKEQDLDQNDDFKVCTLY